jgi:drug/metabolite transporter (DMT)-like permease
MEDRPSLLPILAACLATIFGGSAVVATRFVIAESDPLALALLRCAGSAAVILALVFIVLGTRRLRAIAAADLAPILGLGIAQYAGFGWAFAASLAYIPAARGALLMSTFPIQTLVLAALLGRERLTAWKIAGCMVALSGVAVAFGDRVATDNPEFWKGDLLMLTAAFIGSVYNVFSGPYLRRYPGLLVMSVQLVAGTVVLALLLAISGDLSGLSSFSLGGWVAIAWLIVAGGIAGVYLWVWALEHISPSRVSMAVTLNPIAAAALGALLLDEPVTSRLGIGLAAIILGLALANWPVRAPVST